MNPNNAEHLYRNWPQLRSRLIRCQFELHKFSRGTGKTQGVIADRALENVHLMPMSTGVFVTRTFRQALTNTLPPVIRGWKDAGYVEGIHFVIGKRPPDHWDKALLIPLNYQYTVSWYNGTVIHLISQDRPGSANGLSIDWIIVDECKLINKEKFDHEVIPANRGNRHLYGHLSAHHSIMYCTDGWYGSEAKWIDELEKQVDPIRIKAIESYVFEVLKIEQKLRENTYEWSYRFELKKKINRLNKTLNELRKNQVYFSYASAIDNIHILGTEYILQQRKSLPELIFLVTVLNQKRSLSQDPFYPHLNRNVHCYNESNNDLLSSLNYDFEQIKNLGVEQDADIDKQQGFYIGIDPGGNINTMAVGQFDSSGRIRVVNSFFVKKPDLTRHLIEKFCNYYEYHPTKKVYYYYDQTHYGTHGASEFTYAKRIIETFEQRGWAVGEKNFGMVPEPEQRYQLATDKLATNSEGVPGITFNEINCEYLLISMESADTEEHKGLFRKNKKSEQDKNLPQEEATHFSDGFDTLLWGMHHYPHPRIKSSFTAASSH